MRKMFARNMIAVFAVLLAVFAIAFYIGRNSVAFDVGISVSKMPAKELSTEAAEPVQAEKDQAPASATLPPEQYPLNLNTASREQLMTLPGVGEMLAERIIEYREQVGPFSAIEQIMDVKGIGEGTFVKLQTMITVGE